MILILFLFSSIVFTYPLIFKLGNFLPGLPGDAYSYLWNIWLFWHQIFNGTNPFFTKMIIYPIGANLFFNTSAPLISVLGLPFLNNISFYLGFLIIISVALSSFSLYILALKITNNKIASFVGGLVYGLSPIISSFIQSQHYYFLFSSIFYPVGILTTIKFLESKKSKYLILTFLLFWVILSIDYYSAVLYSLLISLFILTNNKLSFKKVYNYLKIGFVTLILPFLLIFTFEKNFNQFANFKQTFNNSHFCNTNLSNFITPNSSNPFLGSLSIKMIGFLNSDINYDTPSYFMGWGIFLLTICSAIKYRKNKYIPSLVFIYLTFFVLSLGTQIKFGGKILLTNELTPFYYFIKIPILNLLSCPIRFPIIMQFCSAIIVAFFISKHKKLVTAGVAIIILLIIEYGNTNTDFSEISIPRIYNKITSSSDDKTVLEIPSGITESSGAFGYDWSIRALHSQQMYWQTSYHKPRVGGYVSRLTPDQYKFFKNEPVISDIFYYSSARGTEPKLNISEESISKFIIKFNLGYIVLSPNARQEEFSIFIENEFGQHIYEKSALDGFILYKIN